MTDATAVRYFQDKLAYESSPREVVDALHAGQKMTIVDIRRAEAYTRGHVPGAINIPLAQIGSAQLEASGTVIVYDWGPASTESTRACLALAAKGVVVREMVGGYEYWSRLGLGVEGPDGLVKRRASDPLVTSQDRGWD